MAGPLDGIRVLDLSQVVAGPLCTMLLGEQGADVTKVEFLHGEILRQTNSNSKNGMPSLLFNNNRGKKSIALDLNRAEGIELVKRLALDADVFVQNYRAGAIERLGITHEELRAANPNLITVWISGYGQTGPMADRPVFDPVMQAVTGHCSVQINPLMPFPDVHRTILIDKSTALTTAQAITAALFVRERTGEAQHIEVSMLDSGLYFFWPDGATAHTMLDDDVLRGPTLYETMAVTQCADGHIVYYLASQAHFEGLARAIGPEWLTDPRFESIASRRVPEHAQVLADLIHNAFFTRLVADVIAALDREDVPAAPVMNVDEIPDHPQVIHNNTLHRWEHPQAGNVIQPRAAAQFSSTPNEPTWSVPMLGAHTDEVLGDAGFSEDDINNFRTSGIVG